MIPVKYLIKRLLTCVITILAAATLIFVLPRLAPGNPIDSLIERLETTGKLVTGGSEMVEAFTVRFGLDKPILEQYKLWLINLLRGDLGLSIRFFPITVQELISRALPWTIGLLITIIILSWVIGNLLGAIVGWRSENKKLNWIIASICIVINKIPFYIFGLLLILTLCYYIPLFPSSGGSSPMIIFSSLSVNYLVDILYHATLPALSVIIISIGGQLMTMRSLIVDIKGEDYVRFAEARGLRKNRILIKYALRNALLPQVTGLAMSLGSLFSGSLIVEWIFSYPGIGTLFITAVEIRDYNVIQGCTLLVIIGVMISVFIVDIIYPIIDPRVQYEER